MIYILAETLRTFILLLATPFNNGMMQFAMKFVPFVLFFELPVYLFIMMGILRYYLRTSSETSSSSLYYPKVTCLLTAYNEGEDIGKTIRSLSEQIYPGMIEMLVIIDGAVQNNHTYQAALKYIPYVRNYSNRRLYVIPKWTRGGKVSSLNAGLSMGRGEIIMSLDPDSSFDNNMVAEVCKHFKDPDVVAVAGNLRFRNANVNLLTRLQALEYMLSIHASKTGLNEFGVVNAISGAFGVFRKSFIENIGGWDAGSAEDLDITMNMKNYFGRYKGKKIIFEPNAMGHTDGPTTWRGLYNQRLRWDGDLYYLYIRKHALSFTPRLFGWKNFIIQLWTGLFFQLVMPFIIIFYSMYVFTIYSPGFVLGVWLLVYLFYFFITLIFYIMYVTMLSERPKEDLRLAWLLPVVPVYNFILRIFNGLATLKEMLMKAHLDSSLAPWWVLKKTKY